MVPFMVRRVLAGVFVVWAVATITFFAIHASGDPVTNGLRESGATLQEIQRVKAQMGFDQPIFVQYATFMKETAQGDFGNSFTFGSSASALVWDRLPYTLQLAGAAVVLTILLSIPLGVLAAHHHGSRLDRAIEAFAGAGQSIPDFVVGPILILIMAVSWGLLPAAGAGEASALVLPAITLSLYPTARLTRLMRSSALQVMNLEFVETARAKGISERAILWRHVLRNSLIGVITLLGLELAGLLGGAVVTENVFGWPGIGTLVREAFATNDYPVVQGTVIVVSTIVVVITLITDLAYSLVDPRLKLR